MRRMKDERKGERARKSTNEESGKLGDDISDLLSNRLILLLLNGSEQLVFERLLDLLVERLPVVLDRRRYEPTQHD